MLGARGREGSTLRVDVIDSSSRIASFFLTLDIITQNYALDLTTGDNIPPGFDLTQIKWIRFVATLSAVPPVVNDIVEVRLKGLTAHENLAPDLAAVRDTLIAEGLEYFRPDTGIGIDPVTRFPYDRGNPDGTFDDNQKFTQPTLIGFYAEILGQALAGRLDYGLTDEELVDAMDALMDSLLDVQADHGWNGLIPWFDLEPVIDPSPTVGVGDNANLAQSLAVLSGAVQEAVLPEPLKTEADTVLDKIEQFLTNQLPGFQGSVNADGTFAQEVVRASGVLNGSIDRLMTEFRGSIAFLLARFPSLPHSVWDGLLLSLTQYEDRNGELIDTAVSFEGGAFQYFWPSLRNDEQDFIGFHDMLQNAFLVQADYAVQHHLAGFLSAADRPNGEYFGLIGVPQIAETADNLLADLGSTYALASAYQIHPEAVLLWLKSIRDQLPGATGPYGFLDSARSNEETANRYLGIDIASTVLGLMGDGSAAFETYLRNAGVERDFNQLYREKSDALSMLRSDAEAAGPPVLADRSLTVFTDFSSEGVINELNVLPTHFTGARLAYNALTDDFGGRFWDLDEAYDARENRLIIVYSVTDPPDALKVELKDGGDQLLYSQAFVLNNSDSYQVLVIDLPGDAGLADLQRILLVAEDEDAGDFFIHSVDFLHFPSS